MGLEILHSDVPGATHEELRKQRGGYDSEHTSINMQQGGVRYSQAIQLARREWDTSKYKIPKPASV